MWSVHRTSVASTASKATISSDGNVLLFSEILDLLKSSRDLRGFFIAALLDVPFRAFFWEAPAVTLSSIDLPFEFGLRFSVVRRLTKCTIFGSPPLKR